MKKLFAYVSAFSLGLFGLATSVFAAPSSTPEEVLDTVVSGTIDESVDLMQYVIQNYLAYILVLGVAVTLFYILRRFSRIGSR